MKLHFKDYYWKNGLPYGVGNVDNSFANENISYKIIMDPYRKHVSIEKYEFSNFKSLIYSSLLLDFRSLQPAFQTAWNKSVVEETNQKVICLIRNQDDRILFSETHFFEGGLCRECHVHSLHGALLSIHKMKYKKFGDTENSVTLYDSNNHTVMHKLYKEDEHSGEFTDLLSENWDFQVSKLKT